MPPLRRPRRLGAALVGAVVASLVLSGCFYSMIPEAAPSRGPERDPDTSGVPAELLPYYGQAPEWEQCDSGFDCATVSAPLDWDDPSKGDIELALIRMGATDGSPVGSLLTDPGGPGSSGIAFVRDSGPFAFGEALQKDFDIVGWDPRGVGASTAVRCYDAEDMDSYLFDIPEDPRGSDGWWTELTENNRGFSEACDANSEGILPYITTVQSARDLDLLRAILGDGKLNYLGFSYGTFLGATYAGLFPDRVGRLVLDGALDPTVSFLDIDITQGIGFESALRAYMADCLDGSDCPFRGSVDDAMADLGALFASVDRDPIPASDGRMLGAASLMTAVVLPLYSESNWPALTEMLTDVLQGGADYAFYIADQYYGRVDGEYEDNSSEAFRAYNCMDYPRGITRADIEQAEATLAQDAPTIAPYWFGPPACEEWIPDATGIREPITAEGAAPIVVVGTTNDPATPYVWAVALADQLSSGVLITRVGEGHTGYNRGNACVDEAVETYLLEGTAPAEDIRCE